MSVSPLNAFLFVMMLLFNTIQCKAPSGQENKFVFAETNKIKGITVVAPPHEFTSDPMIEVSKINSDWICLVPYGFIRNGNNGGTQVHYNLANQWWGEREEGIKACVTLAHKNGLKVMIKPQIYMSNLWVGDYAPSTEALWQDWENSYRAFISFYADLATKYGVEMFCVGTELKQTVKHREQYWRGLIKELRKTYKNKLVYSSNWDNYQEIPFWDALDYVGVSSYFPLTEELNPSDKDLALAWKPIVGDLAAFAERQKKQILFTEYGYLSVDGCAGKTWELESKVRSLNVNEEAQAQALKALYTALWHEDFWGGGFLWKWFPEMAGHEGYIERDYTPQKKLAAQEIKKWFSRDLEK